MRQALVAAQTEAQRAAQQAAHFRELCAAEYHDLVVVQRPSPAFDTVSSNNKKLLVGAAVVIFLGCLMPIVLRDVLARCKPEVNVPSLLLHVPEIAACERRGGEDRQELVRTLARRIQQSAREDGSVAMFSAVDEQISPAELVVETAKCLALRGEAVLVMDLSLRDTDPSLTAELVERPRPDPSISAWQDWTRAPGATTLVDAGAPKPSTVNMASGAGLVDLLGDGDLVAADVVRPARQFDMLLAGATSLPPEAFASRRLTDLLAELRRRYSTILIVGPDVRHSVDLEMLAVRVSSLVFVAERDGLVLRPSQSARSTRFASPPPRSLGWSPSSRTVVSD
ncbi:MAG: hypothetical protein QM775_29705 [Pirellulales bacterium]